MSIQCRTCAVWIFNSRAKNIFDAENKEILENIEALTGVRIQDDQYMPVHICTCCHLDLYHSTVFRKLCINTENILQSEKAKKPFVVGHMEVAADKMLDQHRQCANTQGYYRFTEKYVKNDCSEPSQIEVSPDLSSKVSSRDNIKTCHSNYSTEVKNGTLRTIEDSKAYVCDLCGHQSSNPKNLDIHILRHKGEKNFECEECGTKHYSKYLLKLHIRVKHQGEMPFVCRYCGQRFYSGSTRVRHEKVRHIRHWSYVCKICGKKYLTKSCLNKHEFLHTGLRPYRCDLCNVAFPRNPGLKIHFRTKQHQKRAIESLNSQNTNANAVITPENTRYPQ